MGTPVKLCLDTKPGFFNKLPVLQLYLVDFRKQKQEPGPEGPVFKRLFRGLKAPAPSGIALCNCSTPASAMARKRIRRGFAVEC